jgi:hypothetical protein
MKRFASCSLGLAVLALTALACGEIPSPPLPGQTTEVPATTAPETGWPAGSGPLVQLAIADLAKQASVAAAEIEVVKLEAVEWPDGCLGCAKPHEMCTEAIVPGYRIVLRVGGQEYEYRTDKASTIRFCPAATDTPVVGDWGPAQPLVEAVVADLAGRLGLDKGQITVVQVSEKQWSDSSIGCPQPGQAYLTVITPGYQIILQVGDKQYDYHTGSQSRFILCEK